MQLYSDKRSMEHFEIVFTNVEKVGWNLPFNFYIPLGLYEPKVIRIYFVVSIAYKLNLGSPFLPVFFKN